MLTAVVTTPLSPKTQTSTGAEFTTSTRTVRGPVMKTQPGEIAVISGCGYTNKGVYPLKIARLEGSRNAEEFTAAI
jgi:hypothetical protein